METIRNYLDNMFAGLPKTARVADLKNNILANMEEKYNELKSQGKSENEAIGIVISEFGNIDELVSELGIRKDETTSSQPLVKREEVEAYLKVKKAAGIKVGIGVMLCILAPAMLILISYLVGNGMESVGSYQDMGGVLGIIALFVMVAIAVGLFIFSGMSFERFKYIEEGVQLPGSMETELMQRYERFNPFFFLSIIVGVCLIILSPLSVIITNMVTDETNEMGAVILLSIVAVSVFLFIITGSIRESYQRLLQIGDYTKKKKQEDKVIGAVASIVWPLAVIIFLISGLVYDKWSICWIVFPITGILFGMFCAAYSTLKGDNTNS